MFKVNPVTTIVVIVPALDRAQYRSGRIQIQIDADRYTSVEIPGWWSGANEPARAAVKAFIAGAADLDPVPSLSPKPQGKDLYVPLDLPESPAGPEYRGVQLPGGPVLPVLIQVVPGAQTTMAKPESGSKVKGLGLGGDL